MTSMHADRATIEANVTTVREAHRARVRAIGA